MVGRDLMPLGIEEEESVLMLAGNANIGFVSGGRIAERGFVAEVEGVAVEGSSLGVVENGLIAEGDAEDLVQDLSGFAGRKGEGNVEDQDQTQHVGRAMNAGQIDGARRGRRRTQLGRPEMVLAVLVAEFELREKELLQELLVPLQSSPFLQVMRAVVARTLVDGAVVKLFPAVEGAVAIRAPVRSFRRAMAGSELRQAATDFAAQLGALTAVVEVEETARSATVPAAARVRQRPTVTTFHGREGTSTGALVIGAQLPPVQLGLGRGDRGRLGERRLRIDVEIAIVRMLLAEVVAGMDFGFTSREDLLQCLDEVLQIRAGEFSAEPKDQSCYLAHGGASLGNRASSPSGDFRKETTPPFPFLSKPQPAHFALRPGRPNPKAMWSKSGGESRNSASPLQFNHLAA